MENTKRYITYSDTFKIEEHPFESFYNIDTEILIVGTFPSHKKNRRYDFFYSSELNNFWKIIGKVYETDFLYTKDFDAVFERQEFLRNKKIGVIDMLSKCYRKQKKSDDESLYPILLTDIFSILDSCPSIEKLVFTSRSEVFGALGLFKTYLIQKDFLEIKFVKGEDKIIRGDFVYKNRRINICVPYSPSPTVTEKNKITLKELILMYKLCLYGNGVSTDN